MGKKEKIKELIRKRLKEENATGTGSSFNSGPTGENYAPVAGKAKNYYYKLGFKPVNRKALNKKAKGVEIKQLWTEEIESKFDIESFLSSLQTDNEEVKKYIAGRLGDFDLMSSKLKELITLLQEAKKETINSYRETPEKRSIYGTDLAISLLDDIIKLFK
jgi:hypothetical protein